MASSERNLHIGDEVWSWRVGRTHVVIRNPERKSFIVDFSKLTGMSWQDVERGLWKNWLHITPQMVKDHIVAFLL